MGSERKPAQPPSSTHQVPADVATRLSEELVAAMNEALEWHPELADELARMNSGAIVDHDLTWMAGQKR